MRPSSFIAITSEGGLLPADFLHELPDPKTTIEGVTPVAYHLAEGERLNEQINRSWNRLKGCWENFNKAIAVKQSGEPTTTDTRERWLLPLFQELGFGRVTTAKPIEVDGRSYPVSHGWNQVPIHLVGSHVDLDCRTPGAVGATKASPHSLVQSALNASDAHLWGIVSNGFNLRLLRDNIALTRLAYVEFDLKAMFDGDLYSEFFLLWLVSHQSRFEGEKPTQYWLERWKKTAEDKTLRALDDLYPGVQKAIAALGAGLVSHRGNRVLLEKLRTGRLTNQEFYKQVLRVIYRMLFLLVAEDRGLLHSPDDTEAALKARRRYLNFYSLARLRVLTRHQAGTPHPDLWHVFQFITTKLGSDTGCPELALPPLGSFLWSAAQSTPDLLDSLISNRHFLEAVHALAFVQDGNVRRAVDYKNLGSEELGSVYQGLLEMHPRINAEAGSFELDIAAGNERKTSGSYYTPDSLVQCLLDSALEPVIAERLAQPKTPKEKETALLRLKVCDKAVGSGHFLLRAAHRIARHLARVRSGEEEPSPVVYRTALRDVIGHCLYGVDINPMAIELCKVTLWLEALEPGKPLSFLDHHMRCGNSLLGATPELIRGGIPDEAYEAIEGDDEEACSALKKRNKRENPKLGEWFIADEAAIRDRLYHAASAIDEMSDSRPEDIRRKEAAFRAAQSNYDFGKTWDLANLWCAAFVIKKHFPGGASGPASLEPLSHDPTRSNVQTGLFSGTDEAQRDQAKKTKVPNRASSVIPIGITTQHLRDFVEGGALPDGLLAEANRLADKYQFFHFHLAFPEMFAQSGFDVCLGNPPWEKVQFEERQFMESLGINLKNANASKRREVLEHDTAEGGSMNAQLNEAKAVFERESVFITQSGRFPLSAKGKFNAYAVFVELALSLTNKSGRVGLIVKTGLATDLATKDLFTAMLQDSRLESLIDFENSEGLFPSVAPPEKFCLLSVSPPQRSERSRFAFNLTRPEQLTDEWRFFTLTPAELVRLNPNTRNCPVFRSNHDALITTALYSRCSILINYATQTNPFAITFKQFFNVTDDAKLFKKDAELEADAFTRDKLGRYQRAGELFLPLVEPKLFHHFDHRFGTFEGVAASMKYERKAATNKLTEAEKADPWRLGLARYWVSEKETKARAGESWGERYYLVFRGITNISTNARTVMAAIVPAHALSKASPAILLKTDNRNRLPDLLALFCSFPFDYACRQKIGGPNLNLFIVEQLPVLFPELFEKVPEWLGSSAVTLHDWSLARVLELTYTAWDLEAFAQDCGWSGPPFRWDEERRFLLRCEMDAAFFHLYLGPETEWRQQPAALTQSFPTPRTAVSYILDTFPIVKRKDEAKFNGDYRTKRIILEIYDALAEAMQTGKAYQTRLDPPPADARCCHPPKQISIPAPTWMDRPLVLPTSRRVVLTPDRYRAAVVPHLLYQAGGKILFDRFRKAYWLLTEPATLQRYTSSAIGDTARGWARNFGDTLQKDRFIDHLKGAVGRQLHFVSREGERWLELRDPKVADDEHVIFDARLALLVADLWPLAEPITPLAPAEEITIQELEAVL
jgi:hypothetical protein